MKRWLVLALLAVTAWPVAWLGSFGLVALPGAFAGVLQWLDGVRYRVPAKYSLANLPGWILLSALVVAWVWIFFRQARRLLAERDRHPLEIAATVAVFCLFSVCMAFAFREVLWSYSHNL